MRYKREDLEEETERDERKLEKTTTTKTRASGLPANIVYVMVIGIVAVVAQAGATPVAAESIGAAAAQQNGSSQRLNDGLVSQVDMGTYASKASAKWRQYLYLVARRKEKGVAVASHPPSPSTGSRIAPYRSFGTTQLTSLCARFARRAGTTPTERRLDDVCYNVNLYDVNGDGWDGGKLSITNDDTGALLFLQGQSESPRPAPDVAETHEVCMPCATSIMAKRVGGDFPEETTWNIKDSSGATVASGAFEEVKTFTTSACGEGGGGDSDSLPAYPGYGTLVATATSNSASGCTTYATHPHCLATGVVPDGASCEWTVAGLTGQLTFIEFDLNDYESCYAQWFKINGGDKYCDGPPSAPSVLAVTPGTTLRVESPRLGSRTAGSGIIACVVPLECSATCPVGSGCDQATGVCTNCTPGTYSATISSEPCASCAAGKASASSSAVSSESCVSCSSGRCVRCARKRARCERCQSEERCHGAGGQAKEMTRKLCLQ